MASRVHLSHSRVNVQIGFPEIQFPFTSISRQICYSCSALIRSASLSADTQLFVVDRVGIAALDLGEEKRAEGTCDTAAEENYKDEIYILASVMMIRGAK